MSRKRLLMLTSRVPFAQPGGDSVRFMHIAKALAADFDLTLLALSERPMAPDSLSIREPFSSIQVVTLPRWRSYLNTLLALPTRIPLQLAYYRSRRYRRLVREAVPQHAGVIAHLVRTGQYVERVPPPRPVILDMTDAISLNYLRVQQQGGSRSLRHLIYAIEQRRLERYERRVVGLVTEAWLVSRVDSGFLFGNQPPANVACLPVPVDMEEFSFLENVAGSTIIFIGNMRTTPNRDACDWFCTEILPLLRARIPSIRLRIIGPADAQYRADLDQRLGVETTGEVRVIREHLEDAFCGICPMRIGAGMQNKVLNYLALGLPCVTSPLGLEGIDVRVGEDLFCYGSVREAVEQIAILHATPDLRMKLRHAGLAAVKRYDTKSVYEDIRDRVDRLLS